MMEDIRARIVIYKGITMIKSEYFAIENEEEAVSYFRKMLEEVDEKA